MNRTRAAENSRGPTGRRLHLASLSTLLLAVVFMAPPAAAQVLTGGVPGALSSGSSLGGDDRPRPLPMDRAFPYYVSIADADSLTVTWQIAPDHYLYRHQFAFFLQRPGVEQDQPLTFQVPPGVARTDQFFGAIEAYYDAVTATVSVEAASLPAGSSLVIQYQGCAEWGFCYPPQSSLYTLAP